MRLACGVIPLAVLCASATSPDGAVLVDGAWRFTAVTDRLIRIEYDEAKHWVNDPTDAFVRSEPVGSWIKGTTSINRWTVIQTKGIFLNYIREIPPTNGSLFMISTEGSYAYHWGDDPADGNLRGTARTFDGGAESLDLNCHHQVSSKYNNSEMHCTWGLISRKGWAVVNETGMPVWRDGWYAASNNTVDLSVFLHGLDFAGALKDFAHAAGPPALPPRWTLGTMFTRWFDFDAQSVLSLIEEFEDHAIPLDGWIFDMNWHQYGVWGSYTWDEKSYPLVQETLSQIHDMGLGIGANTHDHDGISTQENQYMKVCEALGLQPCTGAIPFDLYNKSYSMAQEDIAWGALQTTPDTPGFDFAWIDYQQGEVDSFVKTTIPNINPTIVLNRLRATDSVRRGGTSRPMILSRWGGLGNHRYPVGFSGDQMHNWNGLAFLPYFTSTSANVAYGYWSHDTVGGDYDLADDYELSVRWVQTSAWSPVLRFHDKGAGTGGCATDNVCARILPWDFPRAFSDAIIQATRVRDELVPYIYTAAFSAVTSGLTLVRPMYYEQPDDNSLYDLNHQYLFGPDMVISPITKPSGPDAKGFQQALGSTEWTVYAPRGGWVDRLNGNFASSENVTNIYGILDVPGFARQGAVIPMRPRVRGRSSLARARDTLTMVEFRIMPAQGFYTGEAVAGSGYVIDDDGMSMDYAQGAFTNTTCSFSFHNNGTSNIFRVSISSTGFRHFTGQVKISLPQMPPVIFPDPDVPVLGETGWDATILGPYVVFNVKNVSTAVEFALDPAYSLEALGNFEGALGKIRRARYVKDALDIANVPYGDSRVNITACALTATHMNPDFMLQFPDLWRGAVEQGSQLLATDYTLTRDARRSKFVSGMLGLGLETAKVI